MSDTMNEILKNLEIDDLSGDTRLVAEFAGLETAKQLLLHCDGLVLTIQRLKYMDTLLIKYLRVQYKNENYTKREVIKIAKDIGRSPRETSRLLKLR